VQCESLLDELPVQQLKVGRYTFRAVLATEDAKLDRRKEAVAPFAVNDEDAARSAPPVATPAAPNPPAP